jgi:hypothetical protein
MMAWKLPLHLLFQPLSRLVVLTGRAMAIATGAIHEVGFPALLAAVERSTASFGAAVTDGLHGFPMLVWDGFTIALQVLGTEDAEEVVDLFHATAPPLLG